MRHETSPYITLFIKRKLFESETNMEQQSDIVIFNGKQSMKLLKLTTNNDINQTRNTISAGAVT